MDQMGGTEQSAGSNHVYLADSGVQGIHYDTYIDTL